MSVDNDKLGLHPALVGLKSLWDKGQVAIIMGVGYPNPNYSHFQSMEIMMSADPTGDTPTGWLGRWLDVSGSNPTHALSVGSQLPQVFTGARQQASTVSDSTNPGDQQPDGDPPFIRAYTESQHPFHHESELQADIGQAATNLLVVGAKAASALNSQKPPQQLAATDPGDFGTQLDVVAELIRAGLPTKAYGVSASSFDTHAGELQAQGELLAQVDAGIQNFMGAFPDGSGGFEPRPVALQRVRPPAGVELERRHRPRIGERRLRRRTVGEGRFLRPHAEPQKAGRPGQLRLHDRHPARLCHRA